MVFMVSVSGSDFLFSVNPDYYNPFAPSFNYRMKPAIQLDSRQFFRLRFTIDNLRSSKSIVSNDIIISSVSEIYDIYFFIKYDEKNENIEINLHIPRNSMTSSAVSFQLSNFTHADIGYEKKIEGNFEKKHHLMTISPMVGKIKIGNLYHKSVSYKNEKASFPPLGVYITITKHIYAFGSNTGSPPRRAPSGSVKSKEDLIKELHEVELKYRAGKASLEELNTVQTRLNEVIIKEKNAKKQD